MSFNSIVNPVTIGSAGIGGALILGKGIFDYANTKVNRKIALGEIVTGVTLLSLASFNCYTASNLSLNDDTQIKEKITTLEEDEFIENLVTSKTQAFFLGCVSTLIGSVALCGCCCGITRTIAALAHP